MKCLCIKNLFSQTVFLFLLIPVRLYGADNGQADTLSVAYLIHQADSLFDNDPSGTEMYAWRALKTAVARGDEAGQFGAYYQLVRVSFKFGKNEEAIERARIAEAAFIRLNDKHSLASLYHTWANGLYNAGEMEESQKYSDKSLALAIESGNFFALGLQYYTRASKAQRNNDIYLAIDYIDKVFDVKGTGRKIERVRTRANSLLGGIYGDMNDYGKALNYKLKAAEKFIEFGMYNTAGYDYATAGHYYMNLNRYDSAYACLRKSLDLFDQSEPEYSKATAYRYLALYFEDLKQPDSAIFYIGKSIDLGEQYDQKKSTVLYYETASQLYYRAGNYDEALRYGKKTLEMSEEQDIPEYIRSSEELLGNVYYRTGRPDLASAYYNRYIQGDSLNSLDKIRQNILKLSDVRVREQTEHRLREDAMKRRILLYSLAGSLAVIGMLAFLLRKIVKQRNRIVSINAELNEHKEELKQLLEYKGRILDDREEQYRNLCNNMVNGAVFRAEFEDAARVESGRIVFVSSGWEDMSGKPYNAQHNYLHRFFEDTYPEDKDMLRLSMGEALRNLSVVDVTFRYLKNGETVRFRIRAVAVKNDAGPVHIDGYLVDETDRMLFEEKLISAKEKAEESDRLKTAFFNNISHEIRTPLNAILGFSQLFDSPDVTGEQREMMSGVVKSNAAQLMRMVEDIITLSEIDSDILAVVPQSGNIHELLDHVLSESNNTAMASGKSRLEIMVDNRLPEILWTVAVDGRKLSRILIHLMDNAIKYTDRGYVVLCCEAIPGEKSLCFRVEDTGVGIEEEYLDKVFVRFWKKRDHTREFRGLGIGLPLCRELLRLMHGEITVDSKTGCGSTFCFKVNYQ